MRPDIELSEKIKPRKSQWQLRQTDDKYLHLCNPANIARLLNMCINWIYIEAVDQWLHTNRTVGLSTKHLWTAYIAKLVLLYSIQNSALWVLLFTINLIFEIGYSLKTSRQRYTVLKIKANFNGEKNYTANWHLTCKTRICFLHFCPAKLLFI